MYLHAHPSLKPLGTRFVGTELQTILTFGAESLRFGSFGGSKAEKFRGLKPKGWPSFRLKALGFMLDT
jgi:hypothetical protein